MRDLFLPGLDTCKKASVVLIVKKYYGLLLFLVFGSIIFATENTGNNLFYYSIGSSLFYSSEQTPLWIHANQNGYRSDSGSFSHLWSEAFCEIPFGRGMTFYGDLGGQVGLDDDLSGRLLLRNASLGVRNKYLSFRGGLFPFQRGIIPYPTLSTGSLSVSNNAFPIPEIELSTPGFVPVPWTKQRMAVSGGISHGWVTGDGYIEGHYLHEKWAYVQAKSIDGGLSVYGGLLHQAFWAGRSDYITDPPGFSFDNYIRVFTASAGGDDASVSDQKNVLGDAKGIWDLGITIELEKIKILGYYQHFFEDGSGFRWQNGFDGLRGIALEAEHDIPGLPNVFLFESVVTTDQSGELHDATVGGEKYIIGGRDSYYHNGTYMNGWSHRNRIIGTPLFILIGEDENARIGSNRIKAQHYAFQGKLTRSLSYRTLITHVWHYFAYAPSTIITDKELRLAQWHLLLELTHEQKIEKGEIEISASLGSDVGQMHKDTFGVGLSLKFRF